MRGLRRKRIDGGIAQRFVSFCVSDYHKLKVWRKSYALALSVQPVAIAIPGADYASLRNQILRAVTSISTNIVEGSGKQSRKEFARFLRIALNSASELEFHLMMARDFKLITAAQFSSLSAQSIEIRKMLFGLVNTVLASPAFPPRAKQ